VAEVPTEPHDKALDAIVTERGVTMIHTRIAGGRG
jgi:5-formyltetrahydrofolate cyclo-ligase